MTANEIKEALLSALIEIRTNIEGDKRMYKLTSLPEGWTTTSNSTTTTIQFMRECQSSMLVLYSLDSIIINVFLYSRNEDDNGNWYLSKAFSTYNLDEAYMYAYGMMVWRNRKGKGRGREKVGD